MHPPTPGEARLLLLLSKACSGDDVAAVVELVARDRLVRARMQQTAPYSPKLLAGLIRVRAGGEWG
jgi:hypothetical protein